jgi:hypothetical protein
MRVVGSSVERVSRSPPGDSALRLVEVVAAFSLATDLGLRQPTASPR